MTVALITSQPLLLLLGIVLGRRSHLRRRFNEGVAAGRAAECQVHGWGPDPALAVQKPGRWPVLNRKRPDAPFVATGAQRIGSVLDDMPGHL